MHICSMHAAQSHHSGIVIIIPPHRLTTTQAGVIYDTADTGQVQLKSFAQSIIIFILCSDLPPDSCWSVYHFNYFIGCVVCVLYCSGSCPCAMFTQQVKLIYIFIEIIKFQFFNQVPSSDQTQVTLSFIQLIYSCTNKTIKLMMKILKQFSESLII